MRLRDSSDREEGRHCRDANEPQWLKRAGSCTLPDHVFTGNGTTHVRRSSVKGNSRFASSAGATIFPGVWPSGKKRLSRRDSAS